MSWMLLLSVLLVLTAATASGEDMEIEDDVAEYDIVISDANFVAPTPERENLNEEWVVIENNGGYNEDMSDWALMDAQDHVYYFPEGFNLDSGAKVKVHTGTGVDTATDLYMNSGTSVWNNNGDVATLEDSSGNVVDTYS